MDKKNSKKADQNKPDKDRGDNLKKIERVLRKTLDSVEELKRPHPGGDTENRKITKVDKDKPKVITYKKSDDVKLKVPDHVSKENLRPYPGGDTENRKITKVDKDKPKVITYKKSDDVKLKVPDHNVSKENLRPYPGGDTENRKVTKVDKDKPKVITYKKSDDVKLKVPDHHVSKENLTKKDEASKLIDKDDKRKTREKYTLRSRIPVLTATPKKDEVPKFNLKKEEAPKLNLKREETPKLNLKETPNVEAKNERPIKRFIEHKEKSKIDSSTTGSATPEFLKSDKSRDSFHRKPIIRTLIAKNDSTKIYKAVTFVDQKKKPTTLQIKIPNVVKTVKNVKTETNTVKRIKTTVSRVSIKEKTARKKTESKKKKASNDYGGSPDLSVRMRSPPTEVAKWAPSSINRHTKPYYEAWVNTTLAAISKSSRKDKLFLEKQNILQSFQRALAERPETPELVYENFTDEKYTGRIKVKQR